MRLWRRRSTRRSGPPRARRTDVYGGDYAVAPAPIQARLIPVVLQTGSGVEVTVGDVERLAAEAIARAHEDLARVLWPGLVTRVPAVDVSFEHGRTGLRLTTDDTLNLSLNLTLELRVRGPLSVVPDEPNEVPL